MPASKLSLELPILLPQIEDERDQCVERLQEQLKQHKGIEAVHLRSQDGQALLCLHYDPNLVSLERFERLATGTGATVTERYRHETLKVTSMDCAGPSVRPVPYRSSDGWREYSCDAYPWTPARECDSSSRRRDGLRCGGD